MGVQMELSGCNALGVSANPILSAISRLEEAAVQIKQQAKVTFAIAMSSCRFQSTGCLCAHAMMV
jgi:hypothetical protein